MIHFIHQNFFIYLSVVMHRDCFQFLPSVDSAVTGEHNLVFCALGITQNGAAGLLSNPIFLIFETTLYYFSQRLDQLLLPPTERGFFRQLWWAFFSCAYWHYICILNYFSAPLFRSWQGWLFYLFWWWLLSFVSPHPSLIFL